MNRRTVVAIVATDLWLAPLPAAAWDHTGSVWLPEDMPLLYGLTDNGVDGEICVDDLATRYVDESWQLDTDGDGTGDELRLNCCEETVPGGYCLEAAEHAFGLWQEASSCAAFGARHVGPCTSAAGPNSIANCISFNDPYGDIEETGTLAITFQVALGEAFVYDGRVYNHALSSHIVVNEGVRFVTQEQLEQGDCDEAYSLRTVLAHEVGHFLGMDHTCSRESDCTDPELADALMFWSVEECVDKGLTPDDTAGFGALYGPRVSFECSHQESSDLAVGVVPFELNCVIVSDRLAEITSATWSFGDGGTAETLAASHTYESPGIYTVELTTRSESGPDGCERHANKVGFVRACAPPQVEFELRHDDRLTYQVLNNSDLSVYGCINEILWEVYAGDRAEGEPVLTPSRSWDPLLRLPEPGEYTVVAHLGGPGGTEAAALTFRARDTRGGSGCASAPGPGGGVSLLGILGLLCRRRSQRVAAAVDDLGRLAARRTSVFSPPRTQRDQEGAFPWTGEADPRRLWCTGRWECLCRSGASAEQGHGLKSCETGRDCVGSPNDPDNHVPPNNYDWLGSDLATDWQRYHCDPVSDFSLLAPDNSFYQLLLRRYPADAT